MLFENIYVIRRDEACDWDVSGSKCELDKLAMCYVYGATSAEVPLSKALNRQSSDRVL